MKEKEISKNPSIELNVKNIGVKTERLMDQRNDHANIKLITAPLNGIIYYQLNGEPTDPLKVGDTVHAGERICYLQTNYLINEIICPFNGEVVEIVVQQGATVNKGEVLLTIREKKKYPESRKKQ